MWDVAAGTRRRKQGNAVGHRQTGASGLAQRAIRKDVSPHRRACRHQGEGAGGGTRLLPRAERVGHPSRPATSLTIGGCCSARAYRSSWLLLPLHVHTISITSLVRAWNKAGSLYSRERQMYKTCCGHIPRVAAPLRFVSANRDLRRSNGQSSPHLRHRR